MWGFRNYTISTCCLLVDLLLPTREIFTERVCLFSDRVSFGVVMEAIGSGGLAVTGTVAVDNTFQLAHVGGAESP